jgi:2-polyprenyl-3-methyl-5-hydroxy-6-metoxy-1,4-benzoquinol methylase
MSRQSASKLEGIERSHVERYRFALKYVHGTVLDGACGVGYGSTMMTDAGCEVTGVDLSPIAIGMACTYYRAKNWICGNLLDCPLDRYDAVVSFETIEHVERAPEIVRRLVTATKGRFICSVPNEEVHPFKASEYAEDDSPHLRHYTPVEFYDLLRPHFAEVELFTQDKHKAVRAGHDGRYLIAVCR